MMMMILVIKIIITMMMIMIMITTAAITAPKRKIEIRLPSIVQIPFIPMIFPPSFFLALTWHGDRDNNCRLILLRIFLSLSLALSLSPLSSCRAHLDRYPELIRVCNIMSIIPA